MLHELIRLKFTIQRHTVSWKRIAGLVLGVVAVIGTWAALFVADAAARQDVLLFVLFAWLLGWMVGPILTSGAAVLRPEYFTLLPLPRRRLGFGLLAAVFVGVGGVITATAVLVLTGYAVVTGAGLGGFAVALVSAVLLLVFVVALSRTVYALLGAAMRTRLGVQLASIQYGLLISSLFAGWAIVAPVLNALPVFLRNGFGDLPIGAVLLWTPVGWPVRAVDAVRAGEPTTALLLTALLLLTTLLTVAAAVVLLTPHVGNRTAARGRRRGRVSRATTPLGAVTGKELRTWWRDPWRGLEVRSSVWTGLFIAGYTALAGVPEIAGVAGVAVALMVGLSGANLFGQDGTALWQLVVAERPESIRADIRGRQLGLLVVFGLPALVVMALTMAVSGVYTYTVPITAVVLAALGVGSGVAVVMSVLGVTPGVDPHRRVNATDAGENSFVIMTALHAVLLIIGPTTAMALVLAFADDLPSWFGAATIAVALVNGFGVAWAGGAIAVRRLAGHLPETFGRLRYPGVALNRAGTGVLDKFSGWAEEEANKARGNAR